MMTDPAGPGLVEPTSREREIADDAAHRWGFNALPHCPYVEPGVPMRIALARLLAARRQEVIGEFLAALREPAMVEKIAGAMAGHGGCCMVPYDDDCSIPILRDGAVVGVDTPCRYIGDVDREYARHVIDAIAREVGGENG